ncbi:hypothetical protein HDG70_000906 [Carboxydothermus ferrireducens DSM 11255]|uniref:Uncharacterized protein n=1 Tax=Carboxydothermus ferrireducens DSM 11255 TaxID=1119529 RepID=A0ABX2R8G3_9THEO|nr:hypothetical protein [Carboxydothermus ferrireducens DSM 11255]
MPEQVTAGIIIVITFGFIFKLVHDLLKEEEGSL